MPTPSGIELVGWDETRCRPIYRHHNNTATTNTEIVAAQHLQPRTSLSKDGNLDIEKTKIRIDMNDKIRISSKGRSLEDALGDVKSSCTHIERATEKTTTVSKKRSRKARTYSLSIKTISRSDVRNGGRERKRAYGKVKPVMVPHPSRCVDTRLILLGWDEKQCRPIYKYPPLKQNAIEASPNASSQNKNLMMSFNYDAKVNEDVSNKYSTTRITQKKSRVYTTQFRKKSGLSWAVRDEMEIHSPISIQ